MKYGLIIGARASKMAQIMAHKTADLITQSHAGMRVEVRGYASQGDKFQGDLKTLGGKGAFIKDLENRLLAGEIDCAVHSLKDVPGDVDPHPDLVLCAFLERGDPRDALIMRRGRAALGSDAEGVTLGTSSLRRQAQLKKLHGGVNVIPLRGNVDTRLKKLESGELDGIVVSLAGLEHLGMTEHVTKVYDPFEMLPAVGQGVVCLQIRRADFERCSYLNAVNSAQTETAVTAERRLLRVLEGNCYSAIGGYCETSGGQSRMEAAIFTPDGARTLSACGEGADSAALGASLAEDLLRQGAGEIIGMYK